MPLDSSKMAVLCRLFVIVHRYIETTVRVQCWYLAEFLVCQDLRYSLTRFKRKCFPVVIYYDPVLTETTRTLYDHTKIQNESSKCLAVNLNTNVNEPVSFIWLYWIPCSFMPMTHRYHLFLLIFLKTVFSQPSILWITLVDLISLYWEIKTM